MIRASFAPFLLDVDRIGLYSWDSTVLAYLHLRLEAFSTGRTHALSGCLPLFQVNEIFDLLSAFHLLLVYDLALTSYVIDLDL